MLEDRHLIDHIEKIYALATEEDGLGLIAEHLKGALSSTAVCYGYYDYKLNLNIPKASKKDLHLANQYQQYRGGSILTKRLTTTPIGTVTLDSHLSDEELKTYKNSSIYNECYRPNSLEKAMFLSLEHEQSAVYYLSARRGETGATYRECDIQLLQQMKPHLTQALRIQKSLRKATSLRSALEMSMDRFSAGILILDETGAVGYMNNSASKIMQQEDGLFLSKEGQIAASVSRCNTLLRHVIRQSSDILLPVSERAGDMILVERPSGSKAYGVLVTPLSNQVRDEFNLSRNIPTTLVFIRDSASEKMILPEELMSLFGFTRRESEVVANLLIGKNIKETAKELGLTENSARQYLKRILSKADARTQHELVSRVLNSLPSL